MIYGITFVTFKNVKKCWNNAKKEFTFKYSIAKEYREYCE